VSQRPLDEVEVAGLFVQASGEGVAEGVDGDRPVNTGFAEPPGEPQLDLPGAQPLAAITPKKLRVGRTGALCAAFLEVAAHEPPEAGIQKHAAFCAAFQPNVEGTGPEVDVTHIQGNQRPEPDAGTKE